MIGSARLTKWLSCGLLVALFFPLVAPAQEPDITALRREQRWAATAMVRQQREDGLFGYEFDFGLGRYTDNDFMVRQAGATYGLADYYRHSRDDTLQVPLRRAIDALAAASIPYGEGGRLVTVDGDPAKAGSGNTALALLAELRYFQGSGDGRFARQRRAWLTGLLALRNPHAGFRRFSTAPRESPYFNGEVWFALASYRHLFPDDHTLDAVLPSVDDYMMAHYRTAPHAGFYQWGVMAAAERFGDGADPRYLRFVMEQSWIWLHRLKPRFNARANTCAPAEGLLTAARLGRGALGFTQLRAELGLRGAREMAKNRALQIHPEQRRLDVGDGQELEPACLAEFSGVFLAASQIPRTRIDFTQHCLSALVRYERLLDARIPAADGPANPTRSARLTNVTK